MKNMNMISNVFFILLSIYSFALKADSPKIISLGINCEPAFYLRHFEIRKEAYPFDWLGAINFSGFVHLLEEKFEHFLNPYYLMYRHNCIHNARYDIQFYHDFPTQTSTQVSKEHENYGTIIQNYNDALPKVSEKFTVRIQRFLHAVQGADPVIFFRTHTQPDEARLLVKTIEKLYPHLNFMVAILHDKPEFAHDWSIPRVVSFYIAEKEKSGWMCEQGWKSVLIKLGLIPAFSRQTLNKQKYVGPDIDTIGNKKGTR